MKYIRYILFKGIWLTSIILQPLEKYLSKKFSKNGGDRFPVVFIIGAPRSGSTLIYKILSECFEFSFFTNFSSHFYKIPICAGIIQKFAGIKPHSDNYNFKYGNMTGLGSPSECGEFWYRWFPRGLHVHVPEKTTPKNKLEEIFQIITAISSLSNRPFLVKNLYNTMRIAPLSEAFPNAIFIVCRRQLMDNALSILKGRKESSDNIQAWWSVPPGEIDEIIDLTWSDQIASQLHYIYNQIEKDKNLHGIDNFLDIEYEDFCDNAGQTIDTIEKFILERGFNLTKVKPPPEKFNRSNFQNPEPGELKLLQDSVEKLT